MSELTKKCKSEIERVLNKDLKGDKDLLNGIGAAILAAVQPLAEELALVASKIANMADGLGNFDEGGKKQVLVEAIGDIESVKRQIADLGNGVPDNFEDQGTFGSDKAEFMNNKIIADVALRLLA